ncbi:MAG TPA: hypothetical protein ENJ77_00840 [Candidatus Moranbacteria bacterium]|nr:hypothetical protein [Candidatus Moranbacteria bacterium]
MRKITPASDNLVFFDAEFTSLEFEKSRLLSFGAVKLSGEEFYCEFAQSRETLETASDWVKENILPGLTAEKVSLSQAREQIARFIGPNKPYLVTYIYKYDAYHWYKLFGYDDHLTERIILDFASMLFAIGINPECHSAADRDGFLATLGIDATGYRKHCALADARILREAYLRLSEKVK